MTRNGAAEDGRNPRGLVSLARWIQERGVSAPTAWRWRKRGWLRTVNISGRQYVPADAAEDFEQRAAAGEFAAPHPVPTAPARKGGVS